MYTVEFYETRDGQCPVWEFLEDLRIKSASNKDARIQHKQASLYIELLQQNGTRLNDNITKHLEDGIWELRPGNNRVFYFFYENNTFVLLHQFRKNHKKHRNVKSKKQKANESITLAERSMTNHENME